MAKLYQFQCSMYWKIVFQNNSQHQFDSCIIRRTVKPTDINSIPNYLSDHILHEYVHNNCKISLFHVQNKLYTSPTNMIKFTHATLAYSNRILKRTKKKKLATAG